VIDYSCAKFGDFISAVLIGLIVLTDRIIEAGDRYTDVTIVGISVTM